MVEQLWGLLPSFMKQPLDLQLANGKTTIACLLSASTMAHEHDGDSNDSDAISSDGGAATEDEDEALSTRLTDTPASATMPRSFSMRPISWNFVA